MRTVLVTFLLWSAPASAQLPVSTVRLGWDAVSTATGYRVTVDGVERDVGNPPLDASCQCIAVLLPIIPATAHVVAVTAYTATANSPLSTPLVLSAICGVGQPLHGCWNIGASGPLWRSDDIGFVNPPGRSAVGPNGGLTLQGGGLSVTGAADSLAFTSAASAANGTLQARVTALGTGLAGLDWREDVTQIARHVAVTVSASGAVRVVRRSARGGLAAVVGSAAAGPLPVWLRLTRSTGNRFVGAYSQDGVTWTPVGSTVLQLPVGTRLGLFTLAGSSTTATTAQYDSVTKLP